MSRSALVETRVGDSPDQISKRFHNMLLKDPVWYAQLTKLWWLCAYDAPWGCGRYRHHDGYRT